MTDTPLSEAGMAAMNAALEVLVPLSDLDEQLRILDGMRGMLTDGRAPSYEALLDLLDRHWEEGDVATDALDTATSAALRAAGRSTEE